MVYVPADLDGLEGDTDAETAGDGDRDRDGLEDVDGRDAETLRRQIEDLTRTVDELLSGERDGRGDARRVAGEIAESVIDEVTADLEGVDGDRRDRDAEGDDGGPSGATDAPDLRGFY